MKNKKNKDELSYSLMTFMPQGEIAERVLMERAEHLAQKVNDTGPTTIQTYPYVCFKLGDNEFYGIRFQEIKEILINEKITRVPHAPDYIAGIINRQGMLITVLDLKPFFTIKRSEKYKKFHLIVISIKGIKAAILADHIVGSDTYEASTLEAPLSSEQAINPMYIVGLHRGITVILNMEALMSSLQLPSLSKENN